MADSISIPFTVGGGIRTCEDFERLFKAGADKVSVNSAAVKKPGLISEAAERFGSGRIVVAIDARRRDSGNGWDVYINGGRVNTGLDAVEWSFRAAELGAGEILLTSMDRDGTKDGFDIELTRAVSESSGLPVTASGGAGAREHFYEALTEGRADAVLAASLFHFRELDIRDLKLWLKEKGIKVRV